MPASIKCRDEHKKTQSNSSSAVVWVSVKCSTRVTLKKVTCETKKPKILVKLEALRANKTQLIYYTNNLSNNQNTPIKQAKKKKQKVVDAAIDLQ